MLGDVHVPLCKIQSYSRDEIKIAASMNASGSWTHSDFSSGLISASLGPPTLVFMPRLCFFKVCFLWTRLALYSPTSSMNSALFHFYILDVSIMFALESSGFLYGLSLRKLIHSWGATVAFYVEGFQILFEFSFLKFQICMSRSLQDSSDVILIPQTQHISKDLTFCRSFFY